MVLLHSQSTPSGPIAREDFQKRLSLLTIRHRTWRGRTVKMGRDMQCTVKFLVGLLINSVS